MPPAILWFRRDLRLDDLPALAVAAQAGGNDGVVPLFVIDPAVLAPAGPNRRRFLAGALRALDEELGGTLVLRQGPPEDVVPALAAELRASVVACTADFGPYGSARDHAVSRGLRTRGALLSAVDSNYAVAPGTLRSASGTPFRVFAAYRRAFQALGWPAPAPRIRFAAAAAPSDAAIGDLERGVATPGAGGLPRSWAGLPLGPAASLPPPGSAAALRRLEEFVAGPLARYDEDRDRPALDGTSGLSPHLRFGCIHPRTVQAALGAGPGADRLRDELIWREFYADVLWTRPQSARHPLQAFGEHLRWDTGEQAVERFAAWTRGTTGYPLVDAGMRQLLAEGWMHNRVRMVTASFLVKDLHIDWRLGARWFMWHLVDGDLASNQHGWQWVAGTGTDAAPFHRVLNPERQQQRFDPDGVYISRHLHGGDAPPGRLFAIDTTAGAPIVDHASERRETLERFDRARLRAAAAAERP